MSVRRTCKTCRWSFPATSKYFYKKLDGLQPHCIPCRKKTKREEYVAKRKADDPNWRPFVMQDLTGQRFHRWTVLKHVRKNHWLCRCDCGTEKPVSAPTLKNGSSRSCSKCRPRPPGVPPIHGELVRGGTPEYRAWCGMRGRCADVNNPDYGGRGISVCKRWINSYPSFLKDMGRKPSRWHTLDRIDVDKGYSPANCRWADAQMQTDNRRKFGRVETFSTAEILREIERRTSNA